MMDFKLQDAVSPGVATIPEHYTRTWPDIFESNGEL